MTGRRSHGRLSALNGVVHQGSYSQPYTQLSVIPPITLSLTRKAVSASPRRKQRFQPRLFAGVSSVPVEQASQLGPPRS